MRDTRSLLEGVKDEASPKAPRQGRDDFNQTVKRALADRVRLQCSNPSCRAATSGPRVDPSKVVNVGVAAHIAAAAEGGPRFDPAMKDSDRKATTKRKVARASTLP
jgi:hypothetical protein